MILTCIINTWGPIKKNNERDSIDNVDKYAKYIFDAIKTMPE